MADHLVLLCCWGFSRLAYNCRTSNVHVHETSLSFNDDVVAGRFRIWAGLSVACNARVYQSRVDLLAVLPAKPHGRELAGYVVLNEDICLGDELVEDRKPLWLLEVHCYGTFVTVHREKVRGFGWQ